MLIVMKPDATQTDVERVLEIIEHLGFKTTWMPGSNRTAIGITGNKGAVDPAHFENLNGVADAIRVTKPYKLISKELRPEKSIIKVGNAEIGGDELAIIAGAFVQLKPLNKFLPLPKLLPKAALNSFAAELSNHALLPTHFRAKAKMV